VFTGQSSYDISYVTFAALGFLGVSYQYTTTDIYNRIQFIGSNTLEGNVTLIGSDASGASDLVVYGNIETQNNGNITGARHFFLTGDASLNQKLYVAGNASMSSNVDITLDLSVNQNVFVTGRSSFTNDVSMNRNVDIGTGNNSVAINKDISTNVALDVSGSTVLRGPLSITGDTSFNRSLQIGSDLSINRFLYVNNNALFNTDVSINQNLYVSGRATFGRPPTNGTTYEVDVSGQMRIYEPSGTLATATSGSLVLQHGDASGVSSIVFRSTNDSSSDYAYIQYQENVGGGATQKGLFTIGIENESGSGTAADRISLYAAGGSGFVGVNTKDPQSHFDVSGNARITGTVTASLDVSLNKNVKLGTSNNSVAINKDISSNFALDVSGITNLRAPLYALSDVSLNQKLFVSLDASFNQSLSIGQDVSINRSLYVQNRSLFSSDVSINGFTKLNNSVAINKDISSQYALDVSGITALRAPLYALSDVSLSQKLFVSLDASLNQNLSVGQDVSINRSLYVQNRALFSNDVSLNRNVDIGTGNNSVAINKDISTNVALDVSGTTVLRGQLSTLSDVSINGKLSVSGDISFNGNVAIGEIQTIGKGLKQPPEPMTANVTNIPGHGSYYAYTSSLSPDMTSYLVFDNNGSTGLNSPALYTTTLGDPSINVWSGTDTISDVTSTAYPGYRFHLDLPYQINLSRFDYRSGHTNRYPVQGSMLGSNDGTSWYHLYSFDLSGTYNNTTSQTGYTDFSYNLLSNNSFHSKYALVIKSVSKSSKFVMLEIQLFGNNNILSAQGIGTTSLGVSDNLTVGSTANFYGNVTIGNIENVYNRTGAAKLLIMEPTGTVASATSGSLVLQHGDASGASSIVFRSTNDVGSDYAYIQYRENVGGGGATQKGLLTIGVENDSGSGATADSMSLYAAGGSGFVGVNTLDPQSHLDVSGNARISGTVTASLDVSLNRNVKLGTGNNSVAINKDISSQFALDVSGITNLRAPLYALSDVSLGQKLFVTLDASFNQNLSIGQDVSINRSLYVNNNSLFNIDVSVNQNLYVSGKATFGRPPSNNTTYELDVSGQMRIYEPIGSNVTTASSVGTLTLEHGDASGCSSIMFKSPSTVTNGDYAYIKYQDLSGTTTTNAGLLTIGIENDTTAVGTRDRISLYAAGGSGFVGVNTLDPSFNLDVSGNVNVSRTLITNTIDVSNSASTMDIAVNQISGTLNIGTNLNRTANINIGDIGNDHSIRIGNFDICGNSVRARADQGVAVFSSYNLTGGLRIGESMSSGIHQYSVNQSSGSVQIAGTARTSGNIEMGCGNNNASHTMSIGTGVTNAGLLNIANGATSTGSVNIMDGSGSTGTTTIGRDNAIRIVNSATTTVDISAAGQLTLRGSTVRVFGSSLFNSDVSLNGNVKLGSGSNSIAVNKDISSQYALDVSGITVLRAPLYALSDVSLGQKLFVSQDASFNQNLSVGQDVSINRSLYVRNRALFSSDVSINGFTKLNNSVSINKDISSSFALDVSGITNLRAPLYTLSDVSLGQKLFVSLDASFNQSLSIGQDVSINRSLYVLNRALFSNDVSLNRNVKLGSGNNSVAINKDISSNFALDVSGLTSLRGDVSMNGILFANDLEPLTSSSTLDIAATQDSGTLNIGTLNRTGTINIGNSGSNSRNISIGSSNGVTYIAGSSVRVRDVGNADFSVGRRSTDTNTDSMVVHLASGVNTTGNVDILNGSGSTGTTTIGRGNAIRVVNSATTTVDISAQGTLTLRGSRINMIGDVSVNQNLEVLGKATFGRPPSTNAAYELDVSGQMRIYEPIGSDVTSSASVGTLTLEHGNASGTSSIMFTSPSTTTNGDYAYIKYQDLSGATTNAGLLTIGIENDTTAAATRDRISLYAAGGSGFVGVNTLDPSFNLDVSGNVNVSSTLITNNIDVSNSASNMDIAVNQITGILNIGTGARNQSGTGQVNINNNGSSKATTSIGGGSIAIQGSGNLTFNSAYPQLVANIITGARNGGVVNLVIGDVSGAPTNAFTGSATNNSVLNIATGSRTAGSDINIASNTSSAEILSIGTGANRTGAINIGTGSTGEKTIGIGGTNTTVDVVGRSVTFDSDMSMNRNVKLGSGSNSIAVNKDISSEYALDVSGITVLRAPLYTLSDVSLEQKLFVSGDVSFNQNLFIGQDVSINRSLYVNNNSLFNGDVSVNQNLYVSGKATFGRPPSTNTIYELDVSGQMRIYEPIGSNVTTSSSVGTLTLEHGDASGCSSIMFTSPSTVTNGDYAYIKYQDLSGTTTNAGLLTIGIENDPTAATTADKISLYAAGGTGYVGVNTLNPQFNLDVTGQIRATSTITASTITASTYTGSSNISLFTATTANISIGGATGTSNLIAIGTSASVGNVRIGGNIKLGYGRTYVGINKDISTGFLFDVSGDSMFRNKLFVNSDASFGTNVNVVGDVSVNRSLYVVNTALFGNDVSINGFTQHNNSVSINKDISSEYALDVSGITMMRAPLYALSDVSLEQKLFVSGDVSVNQNLFIGQDVSINRSLYVNNNSLFNGDVSVNQNLYVLGKASFGRPPSTNTTYELDVSGQMRIYEPIGSNVTTNTSVGTLTLQHGDVSGCSSIMFTSPSTTTNGDYAYIKYQDLSGATTNAGLLTIGIENNPTAAATRDRISLYAAGGSGFVGVNTLDPSFNLDVSGNVNVSRTLITNNIDVSNSASNMGIAVNQIGGTLNIGTDPSRNGTINIGTGVDVAKAINIGGNMGTMSLFGSTVTVGRSSTTNINLATSTNGVLNLGSATTTGSIVLGNLMTSGTISIGHTATASSSTTISVATGSNQTGPINIGTGSAGEKIIGIGGSLTTVNVVGRSVTFASDVSLNSNTRLGTGSNSIAINKDISSNFALDVNGITNFRGPLYTLSDVSLGQKLFVSLDASFNQNLSVGRDVSINRSLYVQNRSLFSSDVSVNGFTKLNNSVAINKDISSNFALDVSGLTNLRGNLTTTNITTNGSLSITGGGSLTVNGLPVSGASAGTALTTQGVQVGNDTNYYVTIDKPNFYNDPSLVIYYSFDTSFNNGTQVRNMANPGTYDLSLSTNGGGTIGMIDTAKYKVGTASLKNDSNLTNRGGNITNPIISNTMSFSFWINKTTATSTSVPDFDRIFEITNNETFGITNENFSVALDVSVNGIIYPTVTKGLLGTTSIISTSTQIRNYTIADSSWNHVCWVINNLNSYLYLNGSIVSQNTFSEQLFRTTPPELLLWYKMENNANNDGQLASMNGTLVGSPTFSSSVYQRGAYSLQSTGGTQYISIPSFSWPTTGITVSMWFNRTSPSTFDLFSFGTNGSNQHFRINLFGSGFPYNIYVIVGVAEAIVYGSSTGNGSWAHLAVTLTSGSVSKLYINGSQVSSTGSGGTYPSGTISTNYIGQHNGYTDDFRLYNRVLSDAEILSIYNEPNISDSYNRNLMIIAGSTLQNRDFSGNIDEFRYYKDKALNQAEIFQLSRNTFYNLDISGGFLANGSSVIYEPVGSKAGPNSGSLTLLHGDASGSSSIMFKSVNDPSEYGYIQYEENSAGSTGFHYGLMTIGIENDTGAEADRISLFPSGGQGFVGVNTKTPQTALDVSGDVSINGIFRTSNAENNKKIVLWDNDNLNNTNFYGFGLNTHTLRYQTNSIGSHKFFSGDASGNIGCGKILMSESGAGTSAVKEGGSLTLQHATAGVSSIVFRSAADLTSDFAYIQYQDNFVTGNYTGTECGLLTIGIENDTGSVASSDRIAIWPCGGTGFVGVNTKNPQYTLDVSGTGEFSGIRINGNNLTKASDAPDFTGVGINNHNLVLVSTKTPVGSNTLYCMALGVDYDSGFGYINVAGNSAIQPLRIQSRGGTVGIGNGSPSASYALDVFGNVQATGYNATSDYRIKKNLVPLDLTFNVDLLKPVSYVLKDDKDARLNIGFIAHEVQEVYPFLVNGVKDGSFNQSINYNGFIGILTKEIQVLKKKVSDQEERLASQEAKALEQEARIQALEKLLLNK